MDEFPEWFCSSGLTRERAYEAEQQEIARRFRQDVFTRMNWAIVYRRETQQWLEFRVPRNLRDQYVIALVRDLNTRFAPDFEVLNLDLRYIPFDPSSGFLLYQFRVRVTIA